MGAVTNAGSSSAPLPKPKGIGRLVAFGILLGAVLAPATVFLILLVLNQHNTDCTDGGGEGSLACTLQLIAVTILSIPAGALIGLFIALAMGHRRRRHSTPVR